MSTHNICFRQEIRKIFTLYPLLSRPMPSYCFAANFLIFIIFFRFGFYDPFENISLTSRADRSSKVGENRRTRGKITWLSVSRTCLSHMWHERGSNHSDEKHSGTNFLKQNHRGWIANSVDPDQMPRLIWIYTVFSGVSARTLRACTVIIYCRYEELLKRVPTSPVLNGSPAVHAAEPPTLTTSSNLGNGTTARTEARGNYGKKYVTLGNGPINTEVCYFVVTDVFLLKDIIRFFLVVYLITD